LHKVRIKAKRCRYAAEAIAPLVGQRAAAFAKAAATLQDVLGEHQDAVVAEAWLRSSAVKSRAVRTAFVAGELAGLERAAAEAAAARWRRAWRKLRKSSPERWL
jgi:CHAD domain-containing protein